MRSGAGRPAPLADWFEQYSAPLHTRNPGEGCEPSGTMRRLGVALVIVGVCVTFVRPALGMGRPSVAALQVALRARGLYGATVDGFRGPRTSAAVRRFQRRR